MAQNLTGGTMFRIALFPFSLLLLLAVTACSTGYDGPDGNPDDSVEGSSDPTDTVPDGGETDNPSLEMNVTLDVTTLLNEEPEPCEIMVKNGAMFFEGWSDEDIVIRAKMGDLVTIFAGGSFVAPTESRQFTNLDPPGGQGFPLHFIDGGNQLAISVPVQVEVTGSEMAVPAIEFHQYVDGAWTMAQEGARIYFLTDENVEHYYVADPVTQNPVILVSWEGFRSSLNGSNYLPFGDTSAEGQWNSDGTATLTLRDFDLVHGRFTVFRGYPSDDPR